MTMNLMKPILVAAEQNMSVKACCGEIYCSYGTINNFCKKTFGCSYKQMQAVLVCGKIASLALSNMSPKEVAAVLFRGNVHRLYKYMVPFFDHPYKQIKGEDYMNRQRESETLKRIAMATSKGENITLKRLGVTSDTIYALRQLGYPIISVPGPRGGYNLGMTSVDVCLSWINHWRATRNLPPMLTLGAAT